MNKKNENVNKFRLSRHSKNVKKNEHFLKYIGEKNKNEEIRASGVCGCSNFECQYKEKRSYQKLLSEEDDEIYYEDNRASDVCKCANFECLYNVKKSYEDILSEEEDEMYYEDTYKETEEDSEEEESDLSLESRDLLTFLDEEEETENVCGPEQCNLEQLKIFELDSELETKSLSALEKYNCTSFPFPVKNKYIDLLKIYGFQFDKIGSFEESSCEKPTKKPIKPGFSRDIFKDALDEARELFAKVGYDREILQWLTPLFKVKPKPENPFEYLQNLSATGSIKDNTEFSQQIRILKNNLTLEIELSFELAQIKFLCGMVEEGTFNIEGGPRTTWINQMRQRTLKNLMAETLCHIKKYREERVKYKKACKEEKAKQKIIFDPQKREQALKDLQLWKKYVSPTMENFIRDKNCPKNDGRIKDWFQCLRVPDLEGRRVPYDINFDENKINQPESSLYRLLDVDSLDSGFILDN